MSQRSRQARQRKMARRQLWRRALGVGVLVFLVAAALLAFGSAGGSGGSPEGGGSGDVTVSMTEFAFAPDPIVLRAGEASIEVVNDGEVAHDLLVVGLGKGTPDLAPGQSMVLDLSDQPAGTYRVVCDLPGHTEAGMVTQLTLS